MVVPQISTNVPRGMVGAALRRSDTETPPRVGEYEEPWTIRPWTPEQAGTRPLYCQDVEQAYQARRETGLLREQVPEGDTVIWPVSRKLDASFQVLSHFIWASANAALGALHLRLPTSARRSNVQVSAHPMAVPRWHHCMPKACHCISEVPGPRHGG